MAHEKYILKAESDISINSSKFWAYVNSKKSYTKVALNMTYKNNVLGNIADILNNFADLAASLKFPVLM